MEAYLSTIQAQSFPLSVLDMQGSFSNIPYAYFFENAKPSADFMPTELLRKSLGATLKTFSILAGHLRHKATGNIHIEVNPDHLNVPEFLESSCNSIHFEDIKSANFAWSSWPPNVATVGPVATAAKDGEIRLLNIHVIRLKENSGLILFINVPHYAFDGAGFFAFVNHWADTMKDMARGAGGAGLANNTSYSFDRSIIPSYLPATTVELLEPVVRSIYTTPNLVIDWLAWLAPTTLGGLLSKTAGLAKGEAHLFHASRKSLDHLHDILRPHIGARATRLSDNDILVALVSKLAIQYHPEPKPQSKLWSWLKSPAPAEEFASVRVPCDLRARLGVKENYTGNLLMGLLVRDSLTSLSRPTTAETLADAAIQVRSTVARVQPQLVSEFIGMLSQHPTSYLRPLGFTASRTATSLVCTSQVHFKLYGADFGFGPPQAVSLTPLFAGGLTMAAFLPAGPSTDGVKVLLNSSPVAMQGMLKDPFWRGVFDFVW